MNLPLARWLFSYRREWLRYDLVAGVTVAVVIIPKTMGYAVIAGLPIEVGLYTALAATLAYPLFGTSRPLSVTTASAPAMMTAAAVATVTAQHAGVDPRVIASTLALMVGVVLVAAWAIRLGFLANFISEPVLIGFQAAVAVVIITSQIGALLGAKGGRSGPIGVVLDLPRLLMGTHPLTLAVSAAGIALLMLLPRVAPKLPAPLVWIAVSIVASVAFDLGSHGVKLVGEVPSGLPPLSLPDLSFVSLLWPVAAGIALMSFVETVATARSFSRRDDPPVIPNQELLALAAANAASGFAGGMAATGVPSPTAIANESGARSQLAQWVSCATVAIMLVSLSRFIGLVPGSALAAVIVVSTVPLIKLKAFRAMARIRWLELGWALATLVGSILFGFLEGIIIAVVISVLTLIHQATRPPVYALVYDRKKDNFRLAGDGEDVQELPGMLILRVEGRLMFANAANVAEKLRALVAAAAPRVIVLDCSAILDIEYSALVQLSEAEHSLRERGVALWFAGVNARVLETIRRSALMPALEEGRVFHDLYEAAEEWRARAAGRDAGPGPLPLPVGPTSD